MSKLEELLKKEKVEYAKYFILLWENMHYIRGRIEFKLYKNISRQNMFITS